MTPVEQYHYDFIVSLQSQIDKHLAGTVPPDPDTESPTGRRPKLVWTPALQATYNRMWSEREAGADTLGAQWADLIVDNASGNTYGDSGLWATIAYQMTGDPDWVETAWEKVEAMLASDLDDDNNTRELSAERVIMLDWLWPGLTEERRTQYFEALDRMFTNASDVPVRTGDSDQTTGVYFGAVFYMLAFGDIHPAANDFFNLPGVGGLLWTGRDRTTMRNSIYDYVLMAQGGEWIESQEYNLGTVRHLVLGAYGVQTATGQEYFKEVTDWLKTGALKYQLMLTPDLDQSYQWGDEQYPHVLKTYMWTCSAMMFDDPSARQVVYDLVAKYGATGSNSAEPTVARTFLRFNPYGEKAHSEARMLDARGQGILAARNASGAGAGSMLCSHLPPTFPVAPVDHAVMYFGDLQFYRGHNWALTHPLTYGGVGIDGRGCNVMLHRGMGSPKEWRGSLNVSHGDDWLFTAGTAGGTILPSKFYQPPATWLHEYSRSILWVSGDVDTLVIFDRSHCDDPLALPGFDKYDDTIQKKMQEHALRLWRWHAPVAPTISGQSASWPIGDETCRVSWLRDDLDAHITDQVIEWAGYSMVESEKKFHLDLVPVDDVPGFQTLTTVIEFGDPQKFSSVSLHDDTSRQAQALVLTRADRATWAVLLNTTPGPVLPTYGGASAYHPDIPEMLAPVRWREFAVPETGARIWNMETESGVSVIEP